MIDPLVSYAVAGMFILAIALLANAVLHQREAHNRWHLQDGHTLEFVSAIEFIDGPDQAPTVTGYTLDPEQALVFEFRDAHIVLREDDEDRLNLVAA